MIEFTQINCTFRKSTLQTHFDNRPTPSGSDFPYTEMPARPRVDFIYTKNFRAVIHRGTMRQKNAIFQKGNSVCSGAKKLSSHFVGGRCNRENCDFQRRKQRLQGYKNFKISFHKGDDATENGDFQRGNSVCRGTKILRYFIGDDATENCDFQRWKQRLQWYKKLRSHFDSKQEGKALPFCFALCCFSLKNRESAIL